MRWINMILQKRHCSRPMQSSVSEARCLMRYVQWTGCPGLLRKRQAFCIKLYQAWRRSLEDAAQRRNLEDRRQRRRLQKSETPKRRRGRGTDARGGLDEKQHGRRLQERMKIMAET